MQAVATPAVVVVVVPCCGVILWRCSECRSKHTHKHTSARAHAVEFTVTVHRRKHTRFANACSSTHTATTLTRHTRARTHTVCTRTHDSDRCSPLPFRNPPPQRTTVHTTSQRTASSTTSNTRTALTSWCTPRPSRTFPSSASTRHAADHVRTTTATSRGFAASTQRSSTRKLSRNGQSPSTVSNVPSRHPSLASSHPPPATHLQSPATRHSPPATHTPPITSSRFWTPTHISHTLIGHGPIARVKQ
jgi:hypothetical protein